MTKVYLFDFGNVFLNLDLNATSNELLKLGANGFSNACLDKNKLYEMGKISTTNFLAFYQTIFPKAKKKQLKTAWNKILLDFPEERLEFLEAFSKNKKCMLLSNINDMHLTHIVNSLEPLFYKRFLACFDAVYYSHLVHMRKPNTNIYNLVLNENNLLAKEVFFIDDTAENIETAKKMGFKTWHINPLTDNIINLKQKIKN